MSLCVQSDMTPNPDVTFKLLSITLPDVWKWLTSLLSAMPLRLAGGRGQALEAGSLPTIGPRKKFCPSFQQGWEGEQEIGRESWPQTAAGESSPGL